MLRDLLIGLAILVAMFALGLAIAHWVLVPLI
jgi:hypothetical protein